MWRKINTVCAAGITLAAVLALPLRAQDGLETAPLLDATHAQQAHVQVTAWLNEGVAPPPELVRPVLLRGVSGACVTFRLAGFQVGIGEAMLPPDAPADQPADMAALLRDATKAAIDALQENLRDADLRAAIEARHSTLQVQLSIRDVAPRILVDVQLAGRVEPIRLAPDAPEAMLYARFAPGFHGLRLTDPQNNRAASIWPATALAMNVSPTSQLVQLLSRLDRSPRDVAQVARPQGLTLHRFAVHHHAPPSTALRPEDLVRGNLLLPPRPIDGDALDAFADSLARHLEGRFLTNGELRGTYLPSPGRYDPPLAEPDEALLTAYALTRYVRQERQHRPDDARLAALNKQAQTLAARFADAMDDGRLETSPAYAALIALTMIDNAVAPRNTAVRDRMIQTLLKLRTDDGGFRASAQEGAGPANQTVTALAVAGLAAACEQTRRDDLVEPTAAALDHLWSQSQQPNVNALPWLAVAHERVAELLAQDHDGRATLKAQRDAMLAGWVQLIIARQVIDTPRHGPADVVGGIDLQGLSADAPPNPNWTTAQLLVYLSVATRQAEVRAGRDELGWLLGAGLAARYLRQLQMQPSGCYYVRSPEDAVGGVRLSLWNNAMPPRATAMTLLAAVELRQMLGAFR